jgi:hypothetical protein
LVSLPIGVAAVIAVVGDKVLRLVSDSLTEEEQDRAVALAGSQFVDAVVVMRDDL